MYERERERKRERGEKKRRASEKNQRGLTTTESTPLLREKESKKDREEQRGGEKFPLRATIERISCRYHDALDIPTSGGSASLASHRFCSAQHSFQRRYFLAVTNQLDWQTGGRLDRSDFIGCNPRD